MAVDAFTAETLPHHRELVRTARRYASAATSEDLVQETYLRALVARQHYQIGTNARAWLHRILHHAALSHHRSAHRESRMLARFAQVAPTTVTPRPQVEHRLGDALAALPAPYRQVVELCDVEELSYREIAERLELPLGTVMSRLHRARQRLRAALAEPLAAAG